MIYEYRCTGCGWLTVAHRAVEQRDVAPRCERCGKLTKRVFPPRAQIVIPRAFQLECAREAAKLVLPSTPEEKRYWDTFGIVENGDSDA
jgi:putative FmdB family regulatory protein